MRSGFKGIVASIVCAALVIGIAPAAGATDSAPGTGADASSQTAALGPEMLDAIRKQQKPVSSADPAGGLAPMVLSIDNVRPGGVGALQVAVVQDSAPGISATDVWFTLAMTEDTRIVSAKGDDWSCSTSELTVDCRTDKGFTDGVFPGVVTVEFEGLPSLQDSQVPFRADVHWKQRADAAYAAGQVPWPASLGDPGAILDKTQSEAGDLPSDGVLKVSARLAGGTSMQLSKTGGTAILESMVTGIASTNVKASWRQLCTTAQEAAANLACDGVAPEAKFIIGETDGQADAWMAASVSIPPLTAPTTFVFEVTVSEGGASSKARVRLNASTFVEQTSDPRLDQSLAAITKSMNEAKAEASAPTQGLAQEVLVGRVGDVGALSAKRGSSVTLVATVPGHMVRKVAWTVKGSAKNVLAGAKHSGSSLTFVVPKTYDKPGLMLRATSTIEDGRTVQVDKLIRVNGLRSSKNTARALRMEDGAGDASSASDVQGTDAQNDGAGGQSDAESPFDLWLSESEDVFDDDPSWDDGEAAGDEPGENPDAADESSDPTDIGDWSDAEWPEAFGDTFWDEYFALADQIEKADAEESLAKMKAECKPGTLCHAIDQCLGPNLENMDEDGMPTADALKSVPECAAVQACLSDDEDQTCTFDMEPAEGVLCTIANAVRAGDVVTVPFLSGETLSIKTATVSPGPCSSSTRIDFTGQSLQVGTITILATGSITSGGLEITGGSFLPPSDWTQINPKFSAPETFRITSGGTSRATVASTSNAKTGTYIWGPLAFESTLFSTAPFIDMGTAYPSFTSKMTVGAQGVTFVQEFRTNNSNWPAGLTAVVGVGSDGSLAGDLVAENLVNLPNLDGSTIGISAAGVLRWWPKPKGKVSKKAWTPRDGGAPDATTPEPGQSAAAKPLPNPKPTATDPSFVDSLVSGFQANTATKDDCFPGKSTGRGCLYLSVRGYTDDVWRPLDNMSVDGLWIEWDPVTKVIVLAGDASVGDAANPFSLNLEGTFTDTKNWMLEVSQGADWPVPLQGEAKLTLKGIGGSFGLDKGKIIFKAGGGIKNWTPNKTFKNMSGSVLITNECKVKKINAEQQDILDLKATPPPEPSPSPTAMSVEPPGDLAPRVLPAIDNPTDPQPAPEQPVQPDPAAEKPAAEKPAAEKPAAENPAAEKPAAEKPAAEKPAADMPAADKKEKPAELKECGVLRLELDVNGEVSWFGDLKAVATWKGKVLVRLQKPYILEFVGGFSLPDGAFGPQDWNLKEIEVQVTNDIVDSCKVPMLGKAAPKPDAKKPDATKPDAAKPEAAKPEAAKPDPGKPEEPIKNADQALSPRVNPMDPPAATETVTTPQQPEPPAEQVGTTPGELVQPQPESTTAPVEASPPSDPVVTGSVEPSVPESDHPWYFAITAKGRIAGADVTVGGSFQVSGTDRMQKHLCLIGVVEQPNKDLVTKEFPITGRAIFVYSSMKQFLTLEKGEGGAPDRGVVVPAKGLGLVAEVQIPENMQSKLGVSAKGTLAVTYGIKDNSFSGKVSVDLKGVNLYGKDGETRLSLDGVELGISVIPKEGVIISGQMKMSYITVADAANDIAASTTPFTGELKMQFGKSWGIEISAFVDAKRVPGVTFVKSQSSGDLVPVVLNAFGVPGLSVRDLGLSIKIGTEWGFSFVGDVTLPDRWGSQIGILPGTQIFLGLQVTNQNVCLAFNVSRDTAAARAAAKNDFERSIAAFSVDMFAQHVVYSKRLYLYLAPTGCELPGGRKLEPGIGFDFDLSFGGSLGAGAPTTPSTESTTTADGKPVAAKEDPNVIRVMANVKLPTEDDPNFAIRVDVSAPKFNIGNKLIVDDTNFGFEIDTKKKIFNYRLKGGVEMFGAVARIDFRIEVDAAQGNIIIQGKGKVDVDLALVGVKADFDIDIRIIKLQPQTIKVRAEVTASLLRMIHVGIGVDIDYSNGMLNHAGGKLHSLTSFPIPVTDTSKKTWFVSDGWWTAMYRNKQKNPEVIQWTFTVGWNGKAAKEFFGPYVKDTEIALHQWTGEHKVANALDVSYGYCVLRAVTASGKAAVDDGCHDTDFRGMVQYIAGLGYQLDDLKIAGRILPSANFSQEDLSGGGSKPALDLAQTDLTDGVLVGTNLNGVNLSGANLTRARLTDAKLANANLSGANLTNAILNGADLRGAKIDGATLAKVRTSSATICPNGQPGPCVGGGWPDGTPIQLGGCSIAPGAQCPGADLTKHDADGKFEYEDGDLVGRDLSGANLSGAMLATAIHNLDLTGSNLSGADFSGANLRNVRLGDTKVDGTNFSGAITDDRTICPDGSAGPCTGGTWPAVRTDRGSTDGGVYSVGRCRFTSAMQCPGADLSNAFFTDSSTGVAFTNAVLTKANLSNSDLAMVRLRSARLQGANLHGAQLWSADLRRTDLRGADLSMADLTGANLAKADLRGANMTYALVDNVDFAGAVTDASTKCPNGSSGPCRETADYLEQVSSANFRQLIGGVCLGSQSIECINMPIGSEDLSNLNLADGRFMGADLKGVNLTGANISGALFTRSPDGTGSGTDWFHWGTAPRDTSLVTADLYRASAYRTDFRGADLTGADLSFAFLRGADLRGAKLKDAIVDGADLIGAKTDATTTCPDGSAGPCVGGVWDGVPATTPVVVAGCELKAGAQCPGVDFTGAPSLAGVDLEGAQLSGSTFSSVDLSGALLAGANLSDAALPDANLSRAIAVKSVMERAQLQRANLTGARLSSGNLQGANLAGATMVEADLAGASMGLAWPLPSGGGEVTRIRTNLAGADLTRAVLASVNLEQADLSKAVLAEVNAPMVEMPRANLTDVRADGGVLTGAGLIDATMVRARLTKANLVRANLSRADLRSAVLVDADLREADLTDVNLDGANLRRARMDGATLTGAHTTSSTVCPDGQRGPCTSGDWPSVGAQVRIGTCMIRPGSQCTHKDLTAGQSKTVLRGAKMTGITLVGSRLRELDLTGALLSKANLTEVDFTRTTMSGADLEQADLQRATLERADLSKANLRGAHLAGAASMDRADLRGADLTGSDLPMKGRVGLVRTVLMDRDTICPNGHRASREGFFQMGDFGCFGW